MDRVPLLIVYVASALAFGGVSGLIIRRYRPNWCEQFYRASAAYSWWFFAIAALCFFTGAVWSFLGEEEPFVYVIFLALTALETTCTIIAIGRPLPEPEKPA